MTQKQLLAYVLQNRCSEKLSTLLKVTPTHVRSCEICGSFKKHLFYRIPPVTFHWNHYFLNSLPGLVM